MNDFIDQMESYSKHKIMCFLCLAEESARDMTEAKFARDLYDDGWRTITHGDTCGAACPKCVADPERRNF